MKIPHLKYAPTWVFLVVFFVVTLLQFPAAIVISDFSITFGILFNELFIILLMPTVILGFCGYSLFRHLHFGGAPGKKGLISVCLIIAIGILIAYLQSAINHLIPIPQKASVMWVSSWGDFYLRLILLCVVVPMCEEILFRGLMQDAIAERIGEIRAALLTAVFFALMHSTSFHPVLYLILGLTLSWIYAVTRSLRIAIICHAVNNVLVLVRRSGDIHFPLEHPVGNMDVALISLSIVLIVVCIKLLGMPQGEYEHTGKWRVRDM